ncbi:MAG: hypothetical protein H0T73_07390 [Ardenticatenales bacterium]|nr:hypothetical protein [Ardenticatenales bacterium]
MPTFCPHCHKMVAERPTCPNCGKKMNIPKPGSDAIDRNTMVALIRYVLTWLLGIFGIGVLCIGLIYFLLS